LVVVVVVAAHMTVLVLPLLHQNLQHSFPLLGQFSLFFFFLLSFSWNDGSLSPEGAYKQD